MVRYLFPLLLLAPLELFAQDTLGYLKFNLNVDSAHVVINNDYFAIHKIANGDSLKLPTSSQHFINISIPFDEPYISYQPVYENVTTTITHSFTIGDITPEAMSGNVAGLFYYDSNVMILTDDNSRIFYNDELMGTGFAKFSTEEPKGNITIKNPNFGTEKLSPTFREGRVNLIESYTRPTIENARLFSWIPGASQMYKRQYTKALAFTITTAFLATYTANKFTEYNNELNTFNSYKKKYNLSSNEKGALEWGNLVEKQQNKVKRIENQRRVILLSTLFVYAYNIFDAYKSTPKGGYRNEKKSLDFYLSQVETTGTLGTLRYNF